MAEAISDEDLGLLVLEAFAQRDRTPGKIVSAEAVRELFRSSDLDEAHARRGIEFALQRGWIVAQGLRNYRLMRNPTHYGDA